MGAKKTAETVREVPGGSPREKMTQAGSWLKGSASAAQKTSAFAHVISVVQESLDPVLRSEAATILAEMRRSDGTE